MSLNWKHQVTITPLGAWKLFTMVAQCRSLQEFLTFSKLVSK